ncbi:hypothetical protein DPMN_080739 [Dreissena polymorpha]|uniref:Uncharacterized protein n=1 Tax=Dreissena polymorpha TaxID=45954 RepID=A0A9D4BU36_DREPO|nr:hypothetical protein DPMN_080739 [Dreissena polymorpha]
MAVQLAQWLVHSLLTKATQVQFPFLAACEFNWWLPYRTDGVSSGYSGFTRQHKTAP